MKFRVQHTFQKITLADYEKLYFDEEFNQGLCKAVKLSRDIIKLQSDEREYQRVVKVGPDRQLPKPMAKVLKTDRLFYEEHLNYTWGSMSGQWRTIPMVLANKVSSEGTFAFEEVGSGVLRTVEGDISVNVLGVGSVIEKYIVEDVKRSYDEAASFTQSWIRSSM